MSFGIVTSNAGQADTGTTVTISHTPTPGSNRKLLAYVVFSVGNSTTSITGVTGNGAAFTAVAATDSNATTGANMTRGKWFYLDEANFWAGAANIVATVSAAARVRLVIVELSDATQGAPEAAGENHDNTAASATVAKSLTTVAVNAIIFGAGAGSSTQTPTLDSPLTTLQTLSGNVNAITVAGYVVQATPGAHSTSCTWSAAGGQREVYSVLSIAPGPVSVALSGTSRASPSRAVSASPALAIALSGTARATPSRVTGTTSTQAIALGGVSRASPSRVKSADVATIIALSGIARATSSRGVSTGYTLTYDIAPSRASPSRVLGATPAIITVIDLSGIARATPSRVLSARRDLAIALFGVGRASPSRVLGLLSNGTIPLYGIARSSGSRVMSARPDLALALVGLGRASPSRVCAAIITITAPPVYTGRPSGRLVHGGPSGKVVA